MVTLHPRDLVLVLKLAGSEPNAPSQRDLAEALHESVGEVNAGLRRLQACRLLTRDGQIMRNSLLRLLTYGIPHVFPATAGADGMGLLTGPNAPGLTGLDLDATTNWVWPTDQVRPSRRGRTIDPLYPDAPRAAADDRSLHELLALLDILRVGGGNNAWRTAAIAALRSRLVRVPASAPPADR